MKLFNILLSFFYLLYFVSCNNLNSYDSNEAIKSEYSETSYEIDKYINQLKNRHGIPGIALAIIKDGKTIHKKNYGNANIEHNVPITDKSIFRVYSLTKPIVATGLFQLLEKNKISLEDEISEYVTDLPISWQAVKIKHLLSHSSGLPDIVKYQELSEEEAKRNVFDDPMHFEKGRKFEYNQSNFWLLQRAIENISGIGLEGFIISKQFLSQEEHKSAFFSTDSKDIIMNRVTAYFPFDNGKMQIDNTSRERYLTAANGLNITLDEFIKWDRKLNSGELINNSIKEKMWSLFPYAESNRSFTYGWNYKTINNHISYGFSGSMITAYRNFPNDNLSIIFLSNGFEYWYNIERAINQIAGLVDEEILDQENFVYQILLQSSIKNKFTEFEDLLRKLKTNEIYQTIDFEKQINNVAYMHLNHFKTVNKAIDLFELNKKEYPSSWNVFDSLGEAYQKNGNKKEAIANYKAALKLNTENEYNAQLKEKIKKLELEK